MSLELRGPRGMARALQWSAQGLRAALTHEAAFRTEVAGAIILIPLGIYLGQTSLERVALVGVVILVLVVELLNTAIEAAVDLVTGEHHELAARAKDAGSAAVLVAMLLVPVTWILILTR